MDAVNFILDHLFSGFSLYRRLCGGQWWLCVKRDGEYAGAMIWVNECPPAYIKVLTVEDWWNSER